MTETESSAEKIDPVPGGIPDAHGGGGHGHGHGGKASLAALTLGSIGVVYGDIGTSPLYAFKEAFRATRSAHASALAADVVGVLSLILWALTIIVTIKYIVVVMRADNNGEGGTLSLMALANRAIGRSSPFVLLGGIAGASLFYGDAMITPAMSVLSAVEGVKLLAPEMSDYVVPITLVIILFVFLIQHRGTAAVAKFFGPVTLLWFVTMGVGGAMHIGDNMHVFSALNPLMAVDFLLRNGVLGMVVLGAVFLAVTGVEALYIDMGHFGKLPIRLAWFLVVFPSLMLNYMGQASLVLSAIESGDAQLIAEVAENPFFLLFPEEALPFIVGLATLATIIACQATVSGAFSLTHQAIQLRLLPRIGIRHTSETQAGQIYVPAVNYALMVCVAVLVISFGSSQALSSAYGLAVSGIMTVTASMAFVVVWKRWNWPLWAATALMLPFLAIDVVFLGSNMLKLLDGGYLPLAIAATLMLLMWTWQRGTNLLAEKARRGEVQLSFLLENMSRKPVPTVPGMAIFLTSDPETAPTALLHSLKHYKVLHEKNVILTLVTSNEPRVSDAERLKIQPLTDNFTRITMYFGYMERPDVPRALQLGRKLGWKFDVMSSSFFLSRRTLRVSPNSGMPVWQDKLFIALANNASDATQYFRIPTGRVVEIGAQVTV